MDSRNPGQRTQSAFPPVYHTYPAQPWRLNRLAASVLLALGSLGAAVQAQAVDSCTARHTVIQGSVSEGCQLSAGQALSVTASGSLHVPEATAVTVQGVEGQAWRFVNAGVVSGTTGLLVDHSGAAARIINGPGAILAGDEGALVIRDSQNVGPVRNAGTIALTGSTGYAVDVLDSALDGFDNSGNIDAGVGDGAVRIRDTAIDGDLRNSGTIGYGYTGLLIQGGVVAGSVINSGYISGGVAPLRMENVLVYGDVRNSGTLRSLDGGSSLSNGRILGRFVNSGLISSGITSLWIDNMVIDGGMVNTGTLYGGSNIGISNSVLGSFINSGEIKTSDGDLAFSNTLIRGDLINRGTIYTGMTGYAGLSLYGGDLKGNLINLGSLEGGFFGIALHLERDALIEGNLDNRGEILGQDGIEGQGFRLLGNFLNSGQIVGNRDPEEHQGYGVRFTYGEIGGDFRNGGSISGQSAAVQLNSVRLTGSLVNQGQILGLDDGLVLHDSQASAGLTNLGTITGQRRALALENSQVTGRLVNRGTLSGGAGLEVLGGRLSRVEMSGQTLATGTAIRLGQGAQVDSLVITGKVSGGQYAVKVEDDSNLTSLAIGGRYSAQVLGDVYAPNTPAYLMSDASYRLGAGDQWTVERFVNRGTLSLGAPASGSNRIRLVGDYTQTREGVLQTQLTNTGQYGQLQVSGTARLPSQARIDVDVQSAATALRAGALQDVLSAGRLVSDGSFQVTSNSTLFNFAAVKDGNTVDLTLSSKEADGVAAAARAAGLKGAAPVAQVIDRQLAQGLASGLTPYFASATSSAQVASSVAQLMPLDNASLQANQAALEAIGQGLQARLNAAAGLASPSEGALGFKGSGAWMQPFHFGASEGARSGSADGQVFGTDMTVSPGHRVGVAFAYAASGTAASESGSHQQARLDLWHFLGYSSQALDEHSEWRLYAGAGRNQVDGRRDLSLAGLNSEARAQYSSLAATLGSSLARGWSLSDATRVVSTLRLDFSHIRDEAYHERGTDAVQPLLLNVAARDTEQLVAGLDTRLEHAFSASTRLRLELGAGYDLLKDDGAVAAAFATAPDQRFSVHSRTSSPLMTRGGIGLATRLARGAELSVNYDARSHSDYQEQAASVRFSMPF